MITLDLNSIGKILKNQPIMLDDIIQMKKEKEMVIPCTGTVSCEQADFICERISFYNSLDGDEPITIEIDSDGGDVMAGMAIIDAIKRSRRKVVGVVFGGAYSMGIPILIACDYRIGRPNSMYLIHDGGTGAHTSSSKFRDTAKFYEQLDARVNKVITDNTLISPEKLKEKEREEWWFFAEEALELGVIDYIG